MSHYLIVGEQSKLTLAAYLTSLEPLRSSEIEKILGYIESEHCVESITSLKRLDL